MLSYLFGGILFLVCYLIFTDKRYLALLKEYVHTYLVILVVLFFVASVIIFPHESVDAAYQGMTTWLTVVLPALLPFFIGTELLIGLGIVKFIGTLLEPVMRPVFNVPGEGSFAFTMSITSGYPVGAKIVSRLRGERLLTQTEAQRLISFSNTSGPLFLVGAVGVGMFESSEIGFILAFSHYAGAILVGILFRFWGKKPTTQVKKKNQPQHLFGKAFKELRQSRRDNPPLGILLGNAVKESFNTILMVGGFVILFSVVINILKLVGLIELFARLLTPFGINQALIEAVLVGFFEITNGSQIVAALQGVSLGTKIVISSFLIGWSGFSIHAQVLSLLGNIDIHIPLYFIGKLFHGLLSALIAGIAYVFLGSIWDFTSLVTSGNKIYSMGQLTANFKLSIELFLMVLLLLMVISLSTALFITIMNGFHPKKR